MKNYIPTIEELRGKPKGELEAIFRNATAITNDSGRAPQERVSARETVAAVRKCLRRPSGP